MPSKKTVAIVGSHPLTHSLVPWHKSYIDVWVFNEAASLGWPKRVQGVFQLHQPPIWKNPVNRNDPKHYEWLQKEHAFPIYMQEHYPDVPSSVEYPLAPICDELLPGITRHVRRNGKDKAYEEAVRYFTSSVTYAIALAIYQGYERIEIYGIEMETTTEYKRQRDGVTFWIGIALGRGIEVCIPDVSTLLNSLLYGYEGDVVINRQEFEGQRDKLARKAEAQRQLMNSAGEAVRLALEQVKTATDVNERNKWSKQFFEKLRLHQDAILAYGVLSGVVQENERYIRKCDEMYRAIGGEKAIEAMMSARLKEAATLQTNGVTQQ